MPHCGWVAVRGGCEGGQGRGGRPPRRPALRREMAALAGLSPCLRTCGAPCHDCSPHCSLRPAPRPAGPLLDSEPPSSGAGPAGVGPELMSPPVRGRLGPSYPQLRACVSHQGVKLFPWERSRASKAGLSWAVACCSPGSTGLRAPPASAFAVWPFDGCIAGPSPCFQFGREAPVLLFLTLQCTPGGEGRGGAAIVLCLKQERPGPWDDQCRTGSSQSP